MRKHPIVLVLILCFITASCAGTTNDKRNGKFTDNRNGTVTDNATGLMWQQSYVKKGWESGVKYCEELNHAKHQDWRIPSIDELQSIVDKTKSDITIDLVAFPDTRPMPYWSANTSENNSENPLVVDFSNGKTYGDDIIFMNYVRCVR